ncbi:adenosine deaminase [Vibrio parahaemolyticus]|nr:adenosine deaminase [Vibrio parahaemolyticus]MQC32366.1 adenosine deaminase [Vibrio parahaemolyticus]
MARKSKKQIDKEKKESEENAVTVKQRTRRRIEDIMEQRAFDKMFDL